MKSRSRSRDVPRLLLVAHMDTVDICLGSNPRFSTDGERIVSGNDAGLGADDRAGCAVLLDLARYVSEIEGVEIALLWTSSEEKSQIGMRFLPDKVLKDFDGAVIIDGGRPHKITYGAFGKSAIHISARGVPSHSAFRTPQSVNACFLLSMLLVHAKADGLIHDIDSGSEYNFNIHKEFSDGPSNIVAEKATKEIECRWKDSRSLKAALMRLNSASMAVTKEAGGEIEIKDEIKYPSFQLPENHWLCNLVSQAIQSVAVNPYVERSRGGTDANWANFRGLPSVGIGCGQIDPHTRDDSLNVQRLFTACEIARAIVRILPETLLRSARSSHEAGCVD